MRKFALINLEVYCTDLNATFFHNDDVLRVFIFNFDTKLYSIFEITKFRMIIIKFLIFFKKILCRNVEKLPIFA